MKDILFSVIAKDLKISYFSGTGAGGQHRNKHQNCVRIYHSDSGARTTGQSNKSRKANQDEAFLSLVKHPLFISWQAMRVQEVRNNKTIEQTVKEMMVPENLKIEYI